LCSDAAFPQDSGNFFYRISEIKSKKLTSGTYSTEGYVAKIYTCPPCPKNDQCKPCMRDNIVISENNKLLNAYVLSEKEMILFVDHPRKFSLGQRCVFTVRVLDSKSTSEPINDVELVRHHFLSQIN